MDGTSASAELAQAVRDEADHYAVDAMKKRAILTAGSYDEFKALVACATLTPVTRADIAAKPAVSTNRVAGRGSSALSELEMQEAVSRVSSAAAHVAASTAVVPSRPRTLRDFSVAWSKASTPTERAAYLHAVGVSDLRRLFKVEIDCTLLMEIVACLRVALADGGADVMQLLHAVTSGSTFRLNAAMMSPAERRDVLALIDDAERSAAGMEDAATLMVSLRGRFAA